MRTVLVFLLFFVSLTINAQSLGESNALIVKIFNDTKTSCQLTFKELKVNDNGEISVTDSLIVGIQSSQVIEIELNPENWILSKATNGFIKTGELFIKEYEYPYLFDNNQFFTIKASQPSK